MKWFKKAGQGTKSKITKLIIRVTFKFHHKLERYKLVQSCGMVPPILYKYIESQIKYYINLIKELSLQFFNSD